MLLADQDFSRKYGFKMMKVFIACPDANQVSAEPLDYALRDYGHDVRLNAWETGIGGSIIQKISGGIALQAHELEDASISACLYCWLGVSCDPRSLTIISLSLPLTSSAARGAR
jgi:hypothetical protein